MSRNQLTTGLFMTGDIGNILEGLRLAAIGFPPSQYRDGFLAALAALAASTGNTADNALDADSVVIDGASYRTRALYDGRVS